MNAIKSIFSGPSTDSSASGKSFAGKVPIHPLTSNPTKAWDKIKVKQVVEKVQPTDPSTEIPEDKIRFVFLSDTHSQVEKLTGFVPPGDVVVHAGDFTQIGLPGAIQKFDTFLGSLPHKRKVVIAGNHDLTLDLDMVKNRRDHLHDKFQISESKFEKALEELQVATSRELLKSCIYLLDSSVTVCGIKIHGSPWRCTNYKAETDATKQALKMVNNKISKTSKVVILSDARQPFFGDWGFNLPRGEACLEKWDKIPDDTDILITHGPPLGGNVRTFESSCLILLYPEWSNLSRGQGHGDACFDGQRAGCVELLTTIQTRVKPRYHLFGHIHEGYGITTDGHTTFINGSNCTLRYKPQNPPIVFDFPIPEGHSKAELGDLPLNNLDEH
ncbi:metallophosphoesterase domain-containing protein 1 [Elysia marginata]|uniref:Metallophosphoesterase domain-containing protein 1 n=1 Tax=Elysia marginata TaxID=1093978 RepID=A0AAV4HVT7_9GAST|nr:metallophosphoesterase domain-containing protein 1 [Elysia marginata]